MFLADDHVLGPCPRHCGGVVITLGPTSCALREEHKAIRAINSPGIPDRPVEEPHCDHCDYRVPDRPAYLKDLRAWRERVMGSGVSLGDVRALAQIDPRPEDADVLE